MRRFLSRCLLVLVAGAGLVVAAGGCLQNSATDGELTCSGVPGRECPEGFYCFTLDNTCWHNGDIPDLSIGPDMAYPYVPFQWPDLSVPLDMSMPDMSQPPDGM